MCKDAKSHSEAALLLVVDAANALYHANSELSLEDNHDMKTKLNKVRDVLREFRLEFTKKVTESG